MLSELTATNLDILNSLTESLYTVDREFKITFMNTAAEKLTGFRFSETKGKIFPIPVLNPGQSFQISLRFKK